MVWVDFKPDRIGYCVFVVKLINRSSEELARINEKLGAKDTPSLEEWLRLSDIRNNLTVSIHRKEEELSRLTDSRRFDQPKRANYSY